MSVYCRRHTPTREGFRPPDSRSASQAGKDLGNRKCLHNVNDKVFLLNYLSGGTLKPAAWSLDEQELLAKIQAVQPGPKMEETLYTGDAPLLRLLNYISERVFNSINPVLQEALVFYSGDNCKVQNPLYQQDLTPDIMALWKPSQAFRTIDYTDDRWTRTTWCALAAVGEVKIVKAGTNQLLGYLQNHLQLHPELNAVLGLTVTSKEGYALFYHDADVIHRSSFGWEPGPLYAFVEKLYTRPFRDISMQIVDAGSPNPAWHTKIGEDEYVSESPQALPGPGQRRYTTKAKHVKSSEQIFLKDIWRDERRRFFEDSLFEQAHREEPLAGLMSIRVDSHGYVLDETGKCVRTTRYKPKVQGQANGRYKMRMITKDIGQPLEKIGSLRQFLCVMYDACAVQRNLYRKCQILHRDISEGNIMVAPDTDEYRERCARGYAEVKFVNQVLAMNKECKPQPTCLVIDLGNGADLKVERDPHELTERTGTPKFIARSVSSGGLLDAEDFDPDGAELSPMQKRVAEHREFMHTTEYHIDDSDSPPESEVKFAHQLFHDAESMFWLIAWTLACSIRPESKPETKPDPRFGKFYHTMVRHYPVPEDDTRLTLCLKSEAYWRTVLHPDLASMAPMLHKMHLYVRPEWAYRPTRNVEHVHEALMLLLLAEIVRIDKEGDIRLAIGKRPSPPPPRGMQALPNHSRNSTSWNLSASISVSQSTYPPETEPSKPTEASSGNATPPDKPTNSRLAKPPTSIDGQLLQLPELGSDAAAGDTPEKPVTVDQLETRGEPLKWQPGVYELRDPKLGVV